MGSLEFGKTYGKFNNAPINITGATACMDAMLSLSILGRITFAWNVDTVLHCGGNMADLHSMHRNES